MLEIILSFILAYFMGAIPFGIIVAKGCGVDLLTKGSGNSGATNVFRTLGPLPGATVFLADMIKGLAACGVASWLSSGNTWSIAGAALIAILGHSYSVFLKGKGGKGAATGVGILFFVSWKITIGLLILTVLIVASTKYVSLASLTIAATTPLIFIITRQPLPYISLALIACVLIWVKHIPNIKRLLAGTENKIGAFHKTEYANAGGGS